MLDKAALYQFPPPQRSSSGVRWQAIAIQSPKVGSITVGPTLPWLTVRAKAAVSWSRLRMGNIGACFATKIVQSLFGI